MNLNIIIVEDNETIRDGLKYIINADSTLNVISTFSNVEDFLKEFPTLKPDVVLMDIGLPGKNGIEAVKEAVKINPEVTFIMQTVYEDSDKIFEALLAGASGYLLKNTIPNKIVEAIKEAHSGGSPMSSSVARKVVNYLKEKKTYKVSDEIKLSTRESEILFELTKGNSYKMIADNLNLSIDTIRYHISKVYRKLHVHNQSEAVALAIKNNLV